MIKNTKSKEEQRQHDFDSLRKIVMDGISSSLQKKDVNILIKVLDSLKRNNEKEKRLALEQGFRDYFVKLKCKEQTIEVWQSFLQLSVDVCRRELTLVTLAVVLLGDVFDCLTLDHCEKLFTFVEDNVTVWKEKLFFAACKNNLLRLCNDLLRRLSRSKDTVFCGRILLFLAKFFPFSERSGLNIVSEFNVENVTEFNDEDVMAFNDLFKDDEMMETDDITDANSPKIDYDLYSKFWSLQNYLRNPLLVYNNQHWTIFTTNTECVLATFRSFKLQDIQDKVSKNDETVVKEPVGKFLTNPKLLKLQLADGNFRRSILMQFLILFQYLNAPVKFKNDNQELKVLESEWVQNMTEQVYEILRETPPNAEQFITTVKHILKREEHWNTWKNGGCPELKKPKTQTDEDSFEEDVVPEQEEMLLGDLIMDAQENNKYYMAHPDLTKLWNERPNMEACSAPERNFLMPLDEYFKEAIEQTDPAAMIEDQYKLVNNSIYGWKALRLLALKSPHFFTYYSNNSMNTLPEYLETLVKKIARERPIIDEEVNVEATSTVNSNEPDVQEALLEEDELLKDEKKEASV